MAGNLLWFLYFIGGGLWGATIAVIYLRWLDSRERERNTIHVTHVDHRGRCICPDGWHPTGNRAYRSRYDAEKDKFVFEDITDEVFKRD